MPPLHVISFEKRLLARGPQGPEAPVVLLPAETHVVGGRDHFHWTPCFILNQPQTQQTD